MPLIASHNPEHIEIFSVAWLRDNGVMILIIVAVAILVSRLARLVVRRMARKLEGAESMTQEINLQRANTLTHTISYVIRILVWSIAVLLVLGEIGLNLGPLLAGAGVVGVALGFGAQSLVKDFLSGFFILLEDQYSVGDVVVVNAAGTEIAGKVEALSLRTTSVRAFDGTLNVIPNGNLDVVGNRTKGWARAVVDVGIAYNEDVKGVKRILDELFDELRADPEMGPRIYDGPKVLGVENLGEYEVLVRVIADVRPPFQWEIQREMRQRIKQRFDERGIEIPFPQQVQIRRDGAPEGEPPGAGPT